MQWVYRAASQNSVNVHVLADLLSWYRFPDQSATWGDGKDTPSHELTHFVILSYVCASIPDAYFYVNIGNPMSIFT